MLIDRRHHFHAPFAIYVFITLLVGLGAFNSQNNLLFWAFGFALAVLLVSGVISWQVLRGIGARRIVPARATAGEPLTIRYTLSKRSRVVPAFALGISEALPAPSLESRESGDTGLFANGPAGRILAWLLSPLSLLPGRGRSEQTAFAFVVHVPPRGEASATTEFRPARRGLLWLSDYAVHTGFPFGIVRKALIFRERRTIIVRPRPIAPPPGLLSTGRHAETAGVPRSALAGTGDEFFALREYTSGDSPRAVAWRASARADRMLVRQNTPPMPRRLRVLLRLDGSAEEEVSERAISMAAGLVQAAAAAGFEVGLTVPARVGGLDRRPAPGKAYASRLLDELAVLDAAAAGKSGTVAPQTRSTRGTLAVVIHGGAVVRGFGPVDAVHLSAASVRAEGEPPRRGATAHASASGARWQPLRAAPGAESRQMGPRP